jgi:putative membrane-bound dehydrogenase-like protein
MTRTSGLLLVAATLLGGGIDRLVGVAALAQDRAEPPAMIPHGQDRPPNPPRSPAEAVRAMTVPPGFHVEVVASEPEIVNPVAMTFDERGRIWITESLEYPRRSPGPGRDRVKVLEDIDGDGRADRLAIFADGLNIPSGIAVGHGGVWVANSPDILFLRDTDGDGKADTREVVATGFGRSDTHELPNSLTWGPDGWLYGWNGVFNPSRVKSRNGKTYEFTCAIFRIHPKTRVFEVWCEGTSNPWGIAIDPEGSFFSSACVIDHLWHLVETGYYIRQGGPYPPFTWPIESIVDHKHQKAAYCGIHYFDSPAYPEEYRGRLYMGNIHGNAINVDILERNRSTYTARAAPDFLRANDTWFMPVSQKTGPDGCLYILDWYDQYHCYQDANRDPAGIDRLKGRLYRVRYEHSPRRTGFDLAKSSDEDLIKFLSSANVYDRDIAQRLLTERASPAIRGRLAALVFDDTIERTARMYGLWALIGSGPLNPGFHARLLDHQDPSFRAWGVRAAGNMGHVGSSIRERVAELASDPGPDVRLQVAIAARKLWGNDRMSILLDAQDHSYRDPLIPHIVWRSLHPLLEDRAGELARWLDRYKGKEEEVIRIGTGLFEEVLSGLLPRLVDRLLASPKADAELIARVLSSNLVGEGSVREAVGVLLTRLREHNLPAGVEPALREALKKRLMGRPVRRDEPFPPHYAILLAYCGSEPALAMTRRMARSTEWTDDTRLLAIEVLWSLEPPDAVRPLIVNLLTDAPPLGSVEFRGRILDSLGELDDPAVATIVLKAYPQLPDSLKPRAVELLSERPAWTKALLAAVADKKVPAAALNVTQLRKLQQSRDPDVADRVKAIWGTIRDRRNPQRERVVDQVRRAIRRTPGDPVAGQAVFVKLCAQCHKIHGQGQDVGPDITSNGRNDFDQLVSNVFDPSLVIGPGYQATTIATADGRVLTGLLAEDAKDRIVLKIQGGKLETIPRDQAEQLKTAEVSLMPEDIEKQLSPQEIADLFAFLCLDKPPSDPSAKPLPGAGPIVRRSR